MVINKDVLDNITGIYIFFNIYIDIINQFNDEAVVKDMLKGKVFVTILYLIAVLLSN